MIRLDRFGYICGGFGICLDKFEMVRIGLERFQYVWLGLERLG